MSFEHGIDTNLVTLTRHIIDEQRRIPGATGGFTLLMASITLGCKFVASSVRKAGLANLTGLAGQQNVTGDDQKKLDVIADDVFCNAIASSNRCCIMVTEEQENAIFIREHSSKGTYAVVFDPLDGSSNIDCGVSIGTIFGIYRVEEPTYTVADVLKPGRQMVAAGYCMYGSSVNLVLSFGNGVHHYTHDPSLGEFILVRAHIKVKEMGQIYSVNEGNYSSWDDAVKAFVDECKMNPPGGKPFSARYIGSMVADIHRTLLYGGIYMYPADKKNKNGKLRLLYECFPMAFLMEQAGGKASTGTGPILDLVPTDIHGKAPIFIGSKREVERIEQLYKEKVTNGN